MSTAALVGQMCSYLALSFGIFFFIFACKYYLAILIALFSGRTNRRSENGKNGSWTSRWRNGTFSLFGQSQNGDISDVTCVRTDEDKLVRDEPFVSIQLPFYNEKNVARRVIQACADINYSNYEVIVADDSKDDTVEIIKELNRRRGDLIIKFVHRKDRTGFKGGALQKAVSFMNPNTKYVVVFDADFIPPPDIIKMFLRYFESQFVEVNRNGSNGNGHRFSEQVINYYENGKNNVNGTAEDVMNRVNDWFERRRIGVVQGYQLHYLNKNENWITKGVRAEYSGSYMIERVAEEFFGSMKMITGSVFMIRADILRTLGWTNSITEDWDLTLRMYMEGYKVLYTPLIQAPAEIPTTIRALARQRMRWAEGHTFAVKKYFWDVLTSRNITAREKMEFVYFSPYYLQSFFFLIGTFFWITAELLGHHPYFWTATFGWCLILSNLLALPLMSLSGLYLEQTAREDFTGIFSFIALSYILTPFQAYAAVKGLLEKDEGGWIRTLKTGSITDRILQVNVRRLFSWILPRSETPVRAATSEERRRRHKPSAMVLILLILMSTLIVWVTAAALSVPVDDAPRTFLTLDCADPSVMINGIETNHILTHPDHTSLSDIHTDSYMLSGDGWEEAWGFYLYGPLEKNYHMKGDLNLNLFLYSDVEREVGIILVIVDIHEDGESDKKLSQMVKNVKLGNNSPNEPVILPIYNNKSIKFRAGHSIAVKILFIGESGWSFYIDCGSKSKHSKIEFPGMVMPESLLPLLLIAPAIPLVVLRMRKRRAQYD
ncbi:MAG: glycosyltransferase [Candidatus Bathyarchaeota archaeon]|nr:MAG: glycosyltransferase [Candidatus Bathyarchaeota archaeon]